MLLAKVAAIFTHKTSLLHRINVPGFFNSKIKYGIFLVFSLLLVFWFLLSICKFEWLIYLSWVTKNKASNIRYTTEGKNQINIVWGIIPHYLLV